MTDFIRRLGIYFMLTCALAGVARAETALREEVGALEAIYETRARAVLNTFMRDDQYRLIISAQIKDDEKKVAEYREELDMRFVPGLTIPDDTSLNIANNKLHDLKTRVQVNVLITDDVHQDKEDLIKDLLRAKLHLDDTAGDTIKVVHAAIPATLHSAPTPRVLPELSWKMWSLAVVFALCFLAAFLGWAALRNRAKANPETNEAAGDEGLNTAADDAESEQPLEESFSRESNLEKLARWKGEIFGISTAYPHLASKAVGEYFGAHEAEVLMVFETFGWDTSRQLFPNLDISAWTRMSQMIRERRTTPTLTETESALSDLYRFLLAKVVEKVGKDDTNPFAFIFRLSGEERLQIVGDESAPNLALISLYASSQQLSELLAQLPEDKQNQVVMEMTRLKSLPDSAIQASASSLQKRLDDIRKAPKYNVEGPTLAANFLKSLPADKEQDLLATIEKQNPQAAEAIRRSRVQFDSLIAYPDELLRDAVESVDVSGLVAALTAADPALVAKVMNLVPPKKGRMIQSDLEDPARVNNPRDTAAARRAIAGGVEALMQERNIHILDILNPRKAA